MSDPSREAMLGGTVAELLGGEERLTGQIRQGGTRAAEIALAKQLVDRLAPIAAEHIVAPKAYLDQAGRGPRSQ